MSLFEFTFALSAVILGLALTQVAASLHKLLLAGKQVRWALEPVLLTLIVVLVIVSVWVGAWDESDRTLVTLNQILIQTAMYMALYFGAASALPEPRGEELLDLHAYYDRTRLLTFGALITSMTLFKIYFGTLYGFRQVFSGFSLAEHVLACVLYGSLILVRKRWYNVLVLSFVLVFYYWEISGMSLPAVLPPR